MDSILQYFPDLSKTQIEKLKKLYALYEDWNNKINLISRKDFENFYTHHVLHSLAIAKFYKFKSNETFLDVGTGGGFPGIPLAIYFSECQFSLLDSIQKKIMVVEDVAKTLDLKNANCIRTRIEDHKEKYDHILGRAVKNLPQFLSWTKKNFKNKYSSIIYLSGGDVTLPDRFSHKQYNISSVFSEPFFETKNVLEIRTH